MKSLAAVGELPAFTMGDPNGRSERLLQWRVAIETLLLATRRVVRHWWRWAWSVASDSYNILDNPPSTNRIIPGRPHPVPPRFETVANYFLARFLEKLPAKIRDRSQEDATHGIRRHVGDLIFELMKVVAPGGLEDKDQLLRTLVSPNPCREPAAALKELRRWQTALKKTSELWGRTP